MRTNAAEVGPASSRPPSVAAGGSTWKRGGRATPAVVAFAGQEEPASALETAAVAAAAEGGTAEGGHTGEAQAGGHEKPPGSADAADAGSVEDREGPYDWRRHAARMRLASVASRRVGAGAGGVGAGQAGDARRPAGPPATAPAAAAGDATPRQPGVPAATSRLMAQTASSRVHTAAGGGAGNKSGGEIKRLLGQADRPAKAAQQIRLTAAALACGREA